MNIETQGSNLIIIDAGGVQVGLRQLYDNQPLLRIELEKGFEVIRDENSPEFLIIKKSEE